MEGYMVMSYGCVWLCYGNLELCEVERTTTSDVGNWEESQQTTNWCHQTRCGEMEEGKQTQTV